MTEEKENAERRTPNAERPMEFRFLFLGWNYSRSWWIELLSIGKGDSYLPFLEIGRNPGLYVNYLFNLNVLLALWWRSIRLRSYEFRQDFLLWTSMFSFLRS